MTLTEQAIATIAAGCEDAPVMWCYRSSYDNRWEFWPADRWNAPEFATYREAHPEAEPRCALDPATVLALCALAQEALQSRREGQQMREATDQFVIDAAIAELARQRIVMDDFSDPLNVTALCSAIARALSHPKPESVK